LQVLLFLSQHRFFGLGSLLLILVGISLLALGCESGGVVVLGQFVIIGELRIVLYLYLFEGFFSAFELFFLFDFDGEGGGDVDFLCGEHVVEFGVDVGQGELLFIEFRVRRRVGRGEDCGFLLGDGLFLRLDLCVADGVDEAVEFLFQFGTVFARLEFWDGRGSFGFGLHSNIYIIIGESYLFLYLGNEETIIIF
jgi:hypothetical protein